MSVSIILSVFQVAKTVTTDSRNIVPGCIFFALKGERFDGNQFAAGALEAGAALVVVDDPNVVVPGDDRYLLVEDVLRSLQLSAEAYRKTFSFPIFGITGTNGKTTTKELLHAVLSEERRVMATKGNFNNHIGVPLTLFSFPSDLDIGIVEMGANKLNDIAELCAIAHPDHGIITNIGRAHLERFVDVEGVRRTKGELFDYLRLNGGCVYVNEGDGRVKDLGQGISCYRGYGADTSRYRILSSKNTPGLMKLELQLGDAGVLAVESSLIGQHNAENILAAACAGLELGISPVSLQKAIKAYVPRMNRTQLVQNGSQVILLDAYNANPSSMAATLRLVADQGYGKAALVLGDMFELGEDSEQMHEELIELAGRLLPGAFLIVVGEMLKNALEKVGHPRSKAFSKTSDASQEIKSLLEGYDFVLVKGSRGMALERLLEPMGVQL